MVDLVIMFLVMLVIFIVLFAFRKALFIIGFFFKLFGLLLIALVIGSIVFTYYVVQDANKFTSNFMNSSDLFLLKQTVNGTDTFLAGNVLNQDNRTFKPLNSSEIANAQKLYDDGKISALEQNYYKIFVVDISAVDNGTLYNISDQNIQLTKSQIEQILLSSNARDDYASILESKGMDKNLALKSLTVSDTELKGYIFSYYLTTIFDPKNLGEFFMQFKNNNIQVYDQSALFTAIKLVPASFIQKIVPNSS